MFRRRYPALLPSGETCVHMNIIPIIPSGDEEVVAYLCQDPDCFEQLEMDNPAVVRMKERELGVRDHKDRLAYYETLAAERKERRRKADADWENITMQVRTS